MSYYILQHSTDTKVIGKIIWDQIELIDPSNADELLDNNEVVEIRCRQNRKSILTDLVSCYKLGIDNNYVISQRLSKVFKSYNIQPHLFSSCTIEKPDDSSVNYSVLHFDETFFSLIIDFEKSVFRISDTCTFPLTGDEPIVFVKNYEEYTQKKDELFLNNLEIRLDKFALKKEFEDKYDMFSFFPCDSKLLISERLKDELLSHKELNGFEIMEVEDNPVFLI